MAKKDFIKFRLKGGKTPVSYTLGYKGKLIAKKQGNVNYGMKRVHYIPGVESIFVEDYTGDERPVKPVFEDGLLEVHKDNKSLLTLLYSLPEYNSLYERVDEDAKAGRDLDRMELVEKALAKVNITDATELKAHALMLIGSKVNTFTDKQVRASVKKKAFDTPEDVISEMNTKNYNAKYVGALATLKGVIEVNETRTKVSWANTGQTIVSVAAGQDPISKLGEFLASDNEQAIITLQEIGEQIKRSYIKKVAPMAEQEIKDVLKTNINDEGGEDNESDEPLIENARMLYKEMYDKNVPINKKNDLEWINTKLNE
jgi:hypothetical protein